VNGPGNGVYGFRENGDFVKVGPTGATTLVGNSGLAVDEPARLADGTIYATDLAHNLYRINGATGAATLVGPTGFVDPAGAVYAVALIAGQTNTLYAVATALDPNTFDVVKHAQLVQLNRNTGAASFIANVNNDFVTCALIINGTTYLFDFNSGVSTLNLATGVATPLYDLSSSLEGVHGVALLTPEPASVVMFGIAGALFALGVRRRK
jgi:outer membrane protein assembly factor BamB